MRYLPKSPTERQAMLEEIGVDEIDDLFSPIPPEYRLRRALNVPGPAAEAEIVDYFRKRAEENAIGFHSFLGAGAYAHYRPLLIDALVSRGEFFTAYTPYQAEVSQGTLQAIFEFQTMITELTGMEVANASMYDGSTALAEAVMMASRITGRSGAITAASLHPEYRQVLRAYTRNQSLPISSIGYTSSGRIDLDEMDLALTEETACVVVESPNFFGTVEDLHSIADLAHRKGALLVVAIAEAVSLALLRPPATADIVAMEAQSFGIPLGFGGPYAGVIATKERFVRQMPGRLVGETKDKHGRRGFVLTLSTREQHIRREKATSNICTNQALAALMATVFMTVYGRQGLQELAQQNLAKTAYAARRFSEAGAKVLFEAAPRFNEFVLVTKESPRVLNRRLQHHKIIGGLPLDKFYPELGQASLWCCTELTQRKAIEEAAEVLADVPRLAGELSEAGR